MPSTFFFVAGTFLLAFNFVRPFGLAVSDWLYFIALIFAFIETSTVERSKSNCWINNKFLWPAWLILIGAVLSLFRSDSISTAIIEIVQQIYVITLFISIISIMTRRGKTKVIVNAFIGSGLITSSVALIDYLTGTRLGPMLSGTPDLQLWGRYAGTLGHPNKLGYFLAITASLTLSRLLVSLINGSKRRSVFAWAGAFIVQLLGLYLSGSMMAYLGVAFAVLVLVSSSKIFSRKATLLLFVLIFAVVSFYLFKGFIGESPIENGFPEFRQIATSTIERVHTKTAESRLSVYDEAISYIKKSPIIGAGADQYSTSGIHSDSRSLTGSVHNFLLQTWYAGGLISLIGWGVVILYIGWIALRVLYIDHTELISILGLGLAAAVLGIILMDQFQDAIYQREKWLCIGLLVGIRWNTKPYNKTNSHQK